ncbi:MAG: hypothetical protein H6701_10370 [Myxococcales bacterium]|nr:hypothetical protein [Myxococcales bacterium]
MFIGVMPTSCLASPAAGAPAAPSAPAAGGVAGFAPRSRRRGRRARRGALGPGGRRRRALGRRRRHGRGDLGDELLAVLDHHRLRRLALDPQHAVLLLLRELLAEVLLLERLALGRLGGERLRRRHPPELPDPDAGRGDDEQEQDEVEGVRPAGAVGLVGHLREVDLSIGRLGQHPGDAAVIVFDRPQLGRDPVVVGRLGRAGGLGHHRCLVIAGRVGVDRRLRVHRLLGRLCFVELDLLGHRVSRSDPRRTPEATQYVATGPWVQHKRPLIRVCGRGRRRRCITLRRTAGQVR